MGVPRQEIIETCVPDLRDVPLGDIARRIRAPDDGEDAGRGPFQSSI